MPQRVNTEMFNSVITYVPLVTTIIYFNKINLKTQLKQQLFVVNCIACSTIHSAKKVTLGPLQTAESNCSVVKSTKNFSRSTLALFFISS